MMNSPSKNFPVEANMRMDILTGVTYPSVACDSGAARRFAVRVICTDEEPIG